MPKSYMLPDLYTHSPVRWDGRCAEVWFRGGPGVIETNEEATCFTSPIEAAYSVCTNQYDWHDGERIASALSAYLYDVALGAFKGDARCDEIADRTIVGWNVVRSGSGEGATLRVLFDRIRMMESDWQHEIARRRNIVAHEQIVQALAPLRVEPAFRGPTGRYALVYWKEDQPPMPMRVPFPTPFDVEWLLREGAYRLAAAQLIAEQQGHRLSLRGDPCVEALEALSLNSEERRLLTWACEMRPLASGPAPWPAMVDRFREIMACTIRRIWPNARG